MKRDEILKRLGFGIPHASRIRVIVCSDLKNEADDQYAVIHHLLSPSEEICGIVACHFEWFSRRVQQQTNIGEQWPFVKEDAEILRSRRGKTMEMSFAEGKKLLALAGIDDVPLLRGSPSEIEDNDGMFSEGAEFIVHEAMKDDPRPLYVCCLGAITDLAIAYKMQPRIAECLTAVWIGGGPYPVGECEFNLCQDIPAVNVIMESDIPLWQIPSDVYRTMEVSFAELSKNVARCGELGKYLFDQLLETSKSLCGIDRSFLPECWVLGDNPTVSVLTERGQRDFQEVIAPHVNDDASYTTGSRPERRILVYRSVNVRETIADMFAKLNLCYGGTH